MHNIKYIRENIELFDKKLKERNSVSNVDEIIHKKQRINSKKRTS